MRQLSWLFLFLVFVGIFWTSWKTPYFCDDNTYRLEYCHGPERGERFRGLECEFPTIRGKAVNLVRVAVYHYTHENGRYATAVPLRLFVGLPRWMYAIVNGLVFASLCYLLWSFSGLGERWLVIISAASVCFLVKSDAVFWFAASINYLWPMVLVMLLIKVFLSEKYSSEKFLWWTIPLSIVAAGGHEVISVPLCLTMSVYWVRCWFVERRVALSGRLILSIAFGVGSIMIFLSPVSPLFRASYSGGSMVYQVLCKAISLGNAFLGSPFMFPLVFCVILAVLNPRYRQVFCGARGYLLLYVVLLLGLTICFGNVCARAAWPLNVAAMLAFFMCVPVFVRQMSSVVWRRLIVLSVVLGAVVLVSTAVAASVNGKNHRAALARYLDSNDGIYVIPQRSDWLLGFLFDRTIDPRAVVQVAHGAQCTNGNFARVLNRDAIIGLFDKECEILRTGEIFAETNRLALVRDCFASADANLLVVSCPSQPEGHPATSDISATVRYAGFPVSGSSYLRLALKMLGERARECTGGWGVFKSQVWLETLARDFVYTSFYARTPLRGFYFYRHGQWVRCFIHNRYAGRLQIVGIQ